MAVLKAMCSTPTGECFDKAYKTKRPLKSLQHIQVHYKNWHDGGGKFIGIGELLTPCQLPHYNNNKHLRCGNRKGLLGRTDQTHHNEP